MNLKLLSRLRASDSATLILISKSQSSDIEYYLISRSVAYSVVCTGKIKGDMPRGMVSFDIRMSALIPLIDKGMNLHIQYMHNELSFITEDESTIIVPSYVESSDAVAEGLIEKCIRFSVGLESIARTNERIESVQSELISLKNQHSELTLMQLSGGPSDNPFGPVPTEKLDAKFEPLIKEKEAQLTQLLKESHAIEELDLSCFMNLASAASRGHNLVDLCGEYGIVSMKTSFLLQKAKCPIQSIPGQLFHQLLRDGNGKGFFLFDDDLIYLNGSKEKSIVFVAKYLPNIAMDSSIITRGIVEEKYSIQLKGVLNITSLVRNQFPSFKMDLGAAQFLLSNDLGETIRVKFNVSDTQSLALRKAMQTGDVTQIRATIIDVPSDVQGVLNFFKEELVVYIKKNKVIFQNKGLYIVFGR